jgi:hypothetical protein
MNLHVALPENALGLLFQVIFQPLQGRGDFEGRCGTNQDFHNIQAQSMLGLFCRFLRF